MRYVDADKMIADTEAMRRVADGIEIDGIIKYINDHATADVAKVVRCKDCRKWLPEECVARDCGICSEIGDVVGEQFYCAFGKRMDGGDGDA